MKLLLVEDDPLLQRSLAATLREENFAVDTADNGQDGLDKAQDYQYDAIILDVMLPIMDGWQVLEAIRPENHTPVLMLTARDAIPDRVKGLDKGADDYLTKPFDIDELLARLRALIRRSAGQAQSHLQIGALSMDLASKKVFVQKREVSLTAREYALLEYLAVHRGKVISRTTLYEHLFNEEESTLSNLLDVHVSNLRKKLGPDLITTRRGHGYCIE